MSKVNCNCKHDGKGNTQGAEFQNSKYGNGIRVATESTKNNDVVYTCTVCGAKHNRRV